MIWSSRKRPKRRRAELIELKRQIEGEINLLQLELKRKSAWGEPTGDVQARIERLRSEHYQTRLEIDRAPD